MGYYLDNPKILTRKIKSWEKKNKEKLKEIDAKAIKLGLYKGIKK